MIIDSTTIKEIFKTLNISANKNLGQNFLINPSISEKIVNLLDVKDNEKVLEIGPGLGSLTHYLEEYDLDVVEIDKKLSKFLSDSYPNLNIITNDILKVDVSKYDKIISNLPYYLTTEIVTYLLLNASNASRLVLMMQKEAINRFIDDVNQKSYSPIGILIQLIGSIKKEIAVSRNNFYPIPNVDSVILTIDLDINKKTKENYQIYNMCKSLFINKRKTILNNLTSYLKDKQKAILALQECKIPLNYRPENIDVNSYIRLYNYLNN